jgi:60 kDa SS-A/Ro ribonucleoprotein
MNVGGFSDAVFTMIAAFAQGKTHWVEEIEQIPLTVQ